MNKLKDELEKLSKDPTSGIKVLTTTIHIALSPSVLGKTKEKIKEELTERLNTYHRDYDGMLLHFEDVKVLNGRNSINLDYQGYPHFDVKLKAYVFQPKRGLKVTCSVFLPQNFLLDCRIFDRIVIKVPNQAREAYKIGDRLLVELTEVMHKNFYTKISGKFISVEDKQNKVSNKKKKFLENSDEENGHEDQSEEPTSKKSKKRKLEEDPPVDELNTNNNNDEETQIVKSKKNKKKKDKDKLEEKLEEDEGFAQESDQERHKKHKKKKKERLELVPAHG